MWSPCLKKLPRVTAWRAAAQVLVLSKSTSLLGNACCYLEGWIRQHPVFSSRRGWGEAPVWILPSKVEIQPLAATLEDEG